MLQASVAEVAQWVELSHAMVLTGCVDPGPFSDMQYYDGAGNELPRSCLEWASLAEHSVVANMTSTCNCCATGFGSDGLQ
jgi:hypothetical protein